MQKLSREEFQRRIRELTSDEVNKPAGGGDLFDDSGSGESGMWPWSPPPPPPPPPPIAPMGLRN